MGNSNNRVMEIIKVFANYGFEYIVDKKNKEEKKSPINLRKAFEELGPTFIKIGQVLSTRPDLINDIYLNELSKLQDDVPSESFEEMNNVFYNEFSKNLEDVFLKIDKNPLASASIAQVYSGILKNGNRVVIKIQRPNIKEKMYKDFEILIDLSEKFRWLLKDTIMDPKEALIEIKKSTERELNFNLEANYIKKFKELNKDISCIYAPYIVEELSKERVLTLENISGFKINDRYAIEALGYDKENIAKKLALSYFKQILKDGFFHGDPHPGNILISEGKICFIDFGIVGELSKELKDGLNNAIDGLASEDINKITDFIIGIAIKSGKINRNKLYEDINYIFKSYVSMSLKNIKLSLLLQEVMEIAKNNNLRLPSEFILLIRCMIMVEGIVAELSPETNIITLVITYVKDIHKQYLLSKFSFDDILFKSYGISKNLIRMPAKIMELTDTLASGRLSLNVKVDETNKYMNSLNKMVNRLAFSLVVGGMLIASSIIINSNPEPRIYGVSVIGIGGYFLSAIFGIWLLISIIRSGSLK